MTPVEYLDLIDAHFSEAKLARISRLDPAWGIWSREMNLELRTRIEAEPPDPDRLGLKYVFIYWVLRSQIIELFHKSAVLHMGKRSKLEKQAAEIRRMVRTNKMTAIGQSFAQLAGKMIVQK